MRLAVSNTKDEAMKAGRSTDWKAYIKSINSKNPGDEVSIVIIPSHTALVGSYKITSKVYGRSLADEKKRFVKTEEDEELIVLFNAWCKGNVFNRAVCNLINVCENNNCKGTVTRHLCGNGHPQSPFTRSSAKNSWPSFAQRILDVSGFDKG